MYEYEYFGKSSQKHARCCSCFDKSIVCFRARSEVRTNRIRRESRKCARAQIRLPYGVSILANAFSLNRIPFNVKAPLARSSPSKMCHRITNYLLNIFGINLPSQWKDFLSYLNNSPNAFSSIACSSTVLRTAPNGTTFARLLFIFRNRIPLRVNVHFCGFQVLLFRNRRRFCRYVDV